MATWEERNPYAATVAPVNGDKKKTKKPGKTGLLGWQEDSPELSATLGLLDRQDGQNTGLLSNNQGQQDYSQMRQQYMQAYQNYVRQMQAEQDAAAQKKMEQGLAKNALKYANNTNNANNAASAPGGSGNLGSGIAGNNAALDNGFETMDTSGYNEQAAYIDDAGGAEATNPDAGSSDSGGSYLGAATGALAGYGAGKKNYYTDPAMRSGEDDFGKYHRDYRAEVGGGVGGGVIGYFSEGLANPLIPALVEWSHPYMQDMTRDMIMLGDRAGGAYGAMLVDPIGTWASGRYSNADLAASGFTPLLAPIAGGKAPDLAQKLSKPISDIGHKIADVFGW